MPWRIFRMPDELCYDCDQKLTREFHNFETGCDGLTYYACFPPFARTNGRLDGGEAVASIVETLCKASHSCFRDLSRSDLSAILAIRMSGDTYFGGHLYVVKLMADYVEVRTDSGVWYSRDKYFLSLCWYLVHLRQVGAEQSEVSYDPTLLPGYPRTKRVDRTGGWDLVWACIAVCHRDLLYTKTWSSPHHTPLFLYWSEDGLHVCAHHYPYMGGVLHAISSRNDPYAPQA